MVFKKTNKFREKRIAPKFSFAQQQQAPPAPTPHTQESPASLMRPPKRPSPPERTDSSSSERPTKIIKLRLEPWQLQKFPPGPVQPPRPSPAPPQTSPAPQSAGGPSAPRMRIPLPSSAARTPLPNSVPTAAPAPPPLVKKNSFKIKLSVKPSGPSG
jgi:type VI secretion system secreted protein VgrG